MLWIGLVEIKDRWYELMRYWSPLRAHAEWMAGLREFICGNGDMEPERVARDDQCELGEWLYAHGKRYRHLEEYDKARQIHAALHRHAAHLVTLVRAGRRTEAASHVAPGRQLTKASTTLTTAFARLNRRIAPVGRAERSSQHSATIWIACVRVNPLYPSKMLVVFGT